MHIQSRRALPLSLLAVSLLALCSCGGNGSSNPLATMDLSVSDTPTDGATHVMVAFTGVVVTPADMSSGMSMMDMDNMGMMGDMSGNSAAMTYNFNKERRVDLLQQQDGMSASLLDGVSIPPGAYGSVTFMINSAHSSITLVDGSVHPLVMPAGYKDMLTVNQSFAVSDNMGPSTPSANQNRFTVDFDLRQSINLSGGNYVFTPVLRFVNNQQVGQISGSGSNTAIIGGLSINDPSCKPAAYIYAGMHVTPVDLNPSSKIQPLTTATLKLNTNTGDYDYTAAFLPAGMYTVAFVCAGLDDPSKTDNLQFTASQDVNLEFATPASVNLP